MIQSAKRNILSVVAAIAAFLLVYVIGFSITHLFKMQNRAVREAETIASLHQLSRDVQDVLRTANEVPPPGMREQFAATSISGAFAKLNSDHEAAFDSYLDGRGPEHVRLSLEQSRGILSDIKLSLGHYVNSSSPVQFERSRQQIDRHAFAYLGRLEEAQSGLHVMSANQDTKDLNALVSKIWLPMSLALMLIIYVAVSLAVNNFKQEVRNSAQDMTVHIENESLALIATTDALTNLPNRLYGESALRRLIANSIVNQTPCCVAVADIDEFKGHNDQFGHAHGDEVLRQVAVALKETLRDSDVISRMGGEEFLMILPGVSTDQAQVVLERLRSRIECQSWKGRPVTCSFGVAEVVPTDSAMSVLQRADEALYESKKAGRNRVSVAA